MDLLYTQSVTFSVL